VVNFSRRVALSVENSVRREVEFESRVGDFERTVGRMKARRRDGAIDVDTVSVRTLTSWRRSVK
jgi:hypothetical protein